ncbi:MAG: twitch domain-containing radical SAM protein [Alphaproteobacteria bacterium]|nr:twitch domain-containing radical SAM protein [Alphaproteobacteria bacterium]
MAGFPGHGYGSCEMCSTPFVKSDGTLSCSCMIGYDVRLGSILSDNVADFVNGPTVLFIRDCFKQGLEPFQRCSHCLVRLNRPVDEQAGRRISLHIEPSNMCNLYCEHCLCTSERNQANPPPRRHLDIDAYERMLLDLKERGILVGNIALVGFGEPLFHPRIGDLARMARRAFPDAHIYIDTNGNFGPKKALEIANCGLNKVNVAIDGVDQRSYEMYRRGGNFEKVIAFTRHLSAAVRESGSATRIVWKYILFRWADSDLQIMTARRMAEELGVEIQFHYTVGPDASLRSTTEIESLTDGEKPTLYLDNTLLEDTLSPPLHLRSIEAWSEEVSPPNPAISAPRPSDSFCYLAFIHLQITPSGTAKMCCIAGEEVMQDGKPMSVYSHTLDDIWNSDYMRQARKDMFDGRHIKACQRCYREEAALGESRRTMMNSGWSSKLGVTAAQVLESASQNGFVVDGHPSYYQLNMGNLCNLSCRMCNGDYSSRILADPVLSSWNPSCSLDLPQWKDGWLALGPRQCFGVEYDGFYPLDYDGVRAPIRWSDGNSEISMKLPKGLVLSNLKASICSPAGSIQTLRITLNGFEIFFGSVGDQAEELDVDISSYVNSDKLRLRFQSSTVGFADDDRPFGVGVQKIMVSAAANSGAELISLSRFEKPGGWWGQNPFVFGELMKNPHSLRRLILQGGEPLVNPATDEIMNQLVSFGVAQDIDLEIVSNFTILRDQTLDNLSRFKNIELEASVDGIGAVYEYIRFPGKWHKIEENLARAKLVPNIKLYFVVAVQAYNLLDVANILDYCDRQGIRCSAHFLVGPIYLNVLVLPQSVRQLAVERLKSCRDRAEHKWIKDMAAYLINFLEQKMPIQYCDQIANFMQYTNDLDVSRGQSLNKTLPELVEAFEITGYPWVADLRYARSGNASF